MPKNTFLIAEVGQAHDGSLGILHSYIDALTGLGIDAIKFQTHIAEAESSFEEPFRVKFSYEDNTRYDYWKRVGFSFEQWQEIKCHCVDNGLEFLSSPFSCAAVDWLEKLGVARYKIGSGEVTNHLMLEKIARTGKEVLLSSGMSNLKELDQAVELLKRYGSEVVVLQCTTKYPTPIDEVGLNVIGELRSRYKLKTGFSDHSGSIYPSIAAATLGAEVLEFHVVFDKLMFGPDSPASLTISEVKELVSAVRAIDKSLSTSVNKDDNREFALVKAIFEKSLCVNKDISKGVVIGFDDLEAKKPANKGINASDFKSVIGKTLKIEKKKWDF